MLLVNFNTWLEELRLIFICEVARWNCLDIIYDFIPSSINRFHSNKFHCGIYELNILEIMPMISILVKLYF